jgi:hypothetical protein
VQCLGRRDEAKVDDEVDAALDDVLGLMEAECVDACAPDVTEVEA